MLSDRKTTAFISGSAYEYGIFGDSGSSFIRDLSRSLLRNDFKIVSGYGLGVGAHVVDGALDEVYLEKKANITDHLQVFPFPPIDSPEPIMSRYRTDVVSRAGIAIFVFGNKLEDISIKEADGMWKEFEIARFNNSLLIPVGASGYTSERIWNQVVHQFDDYFEEREKFALYEQLGDRSIHPNQLIDIILQIAQ